MSHRRGLRVAVLAAGVLGLAGTQGVATAQPSAPQQPSPYSAATAANVPAAMLQAMQRDLGLTAAEAKQALANQVDTGATAGKLQLRLAGSYAGSYVTGKTGGTLHVSTTDRGKAAVIAAHGAKATVVKYSLAQLDAAKAKLDRASAGSDTSHTPVWAVDVRSNRVVLQTSAPEKARAFAKAAGVALGMLTIERSNIQPRPLYDLRGGDAYYMGSGGRCSVGFPVTRGGTQAGFATAGHCGKAGTSVSGHNRAQLGSFQGSSFPGNDYAWVAANSQWTPTARVNGYGKVADRAVEGSTVMQAGQQVCRSGSTTGWHCGSITRLNTSVTYPEGTITGVTQTTVCAEPGDSGGSYISGTQAQGVTSGGSGDCSRGGTTFFQPINELLQVYGLTLYTGATDPGDPDPGDPGDPSGSWAEGTVYKVGDVVTYNDVQYRCIQAHQAISGWTPENVPALWERV
ncbi:S1 family peptidase [Actinomadura spongiicola]|uniref:S1 family peptidase n=1 Tax=Actinomadura spongiicola TaxID=2303421 RepID=A0A372GDM1_9ACTN|nr:carbohydrate-binding protein [Actinomadura spongiicola]RFS83437.1 S1 family peptidase [Actinomadura spongiicola]